MSELVVTHRGVVYPWQCDQNGHLNVMFYVGKLDESTWTLIGDAGMTPEIMRAGKHGMVAVDQRISYRKELFAGDLVTIRSAFLEVRTKSFRFVHEMRNGGTGEIAAVCALTGVHIDAGDRKARELPPWFAEKARAMVVPYDLDAR